MELHDAVLRLGDLEAERVEREVGGEPDVAAPVRGEVRAEDVGVGRAGAAVHPVGRDDEVVGPCELGGGRGLRAEAEPHAEAGAAVVEDLQEGTAAEGREPVPAGGEEAAAVGDVDVVPADELPPQRAVHVRVGVLDAAEGLVGQDDAEAEGVVGALRSQTVTSRAGSRRLRRARRRARGAAPDDGGAHGHRPCRLGGRFASEGGVELGVVPAVHEEGLGGGVEFHGAASGMSSSAVSSAF